LWPDILVLDEFANAASQEVSEFDIRPSEYSSTAVVQFPQSLFPVMW